MKRTIPFAFMAMIIGVSPVFADETLQNACMKETSAFNFPEGMPEEIIVQIMTPKCDCVVAGAQDQAIRDNLLEYVAIEDLAERSAVINASARELLWNCFDVPEALRVVPDEAGSAEG